MPAERSELRVVRAAAAARTAAQLEYRAALEAAVEAGVPVAQVARAAGVSRQRLYQMLGPRPRVVDSPETDGADVVDVAALEARLGELERRHDHRLELMMSRYQAGDWRGETAHRNAQAGKRRRKGLGPLPTVKAQIRLNCEAELARAVDENPSDPVFAAVGREIDEAWEIRCRLNEVSNAGAAFLGADFR